MQTLVYNLSSWVLTQIYSVRFVILSKNKIKDIYVIIWQNYLVLGNLGGIKTAFIQSD